MHNYCLLVHRVPLTPTQCKIRSLTVASPNQLTNRSLSPVVVCIRECSMLSVGASVQRLIFRAFASTPLNPYPFYFSRWRVVPAGSAVHAAHKTVRTTKWNGKNRFNTSFQKWSTISLTPLLTILLFARTLLSFKRRVVCTWRHIILTPNPDPQSKLEQIQPGNNLSESSNERSCSANYKAWTETLNNIKSRKDINENNKENRFETASFHVHFAVRTA